MECGFLPFQGRCRGRWEAPKRPRSWQTCLRPPSRPSTGRRGGSGWGTPGHRGVPAPPGSHPSLLGTPRVVSAPQIWGLVLFQDRRRDSFHGVGPHRGEAGGDHQRSVLPHSWVCPGNPAARREKGHGGDKGEPWCCCPLQDTPSPRAASRPSPSSAPATAPSLSSCPGELRAWGALGSLQGGLGLLEQVWGGSGCIAGGFVWVWGC